MTRIYTYIGDVIIYSLFFFVFMVALGLIFFGGYKDVVIAYKANSYCTDHGYDGSRNSGLQCFREDCSYNAVGAKTCKTVYEDIP